MKISIYMYKVCHNYTVSPDVANFWRSHPSPRAPWRLTRILGVSRSAKADDIKRAYRKRSLRFHPATWMFQCIENATVDGSEIPTNHLGMYATFWNPVDIGINYITIGAGFLPSTVSPLPLFLRGLDVTNASPETRKLPGFTLKLSNLLYTHTSGRMYIFRCLRIHGKMGLEATGLEAWNTYCIQCVFVEMLSMSRHTSPNYKDLRKVVLIYMNGESMGILLRCLKEAFEVAKMQLYAIVSNNYIPIPILVMRANSAESAPLESNSSCQWPMMSTAKGCFLSQ